MLFEGKFEYKCFLLRYMEIPYLKRLRDFASNKDEITELSILRAMAQPAYVIACYMVLLDKIDLTVEWDHHHCQCNGSNFGSGF